MNIYNPKENQAYSLQGDGTKVIVLAETSVTLTPAYGVSTL